MSGYYQTEKVEGKHGALARWWIYQRERFPVFGHAPLIFAFSFSALCYSMLLRGQTALPRVSAAAVAFFTSFIFFLQLRIADEHKDFEEDSRYRSYRPVPRGLVTLGELGAVAAAGAVVQLSLAIMLEPALVIPLSLAWMFLVLMSREFFAGRWLRARPLVYMLTHMLIVPVIDFYAASCDWLSSSELQPPGMFWFLAVSFWNGVVIEIGRKIRAPRDEEEGVETYSALWGLPVAVAAWLGAMTLTAFCALMAARRVHFAGAVSVVLASLLVAALIVSLRFLHRPLSQRAKAFEALSGVWTLLMYLSLGAAPLILKSL